MFFRPPQLEGLGILDLDSRQFITQLLILLRLIWVDDELVVCGDAQVARQLLSFALLSFSPSP